MPSETADNETHIDGLLLIGDAPHASDDGALAQAAPNPRSLLSAQQRTALTALLGDNVRFDEPMRRHTTLKMGGPVDAFCRPTNTADLKALVQWAGANTLPILVVGGGSNMLVRDGGIRGLALSTDNLRALELVGPHSQNLLVGAGVSTGKVLSLAMKNDLGGVEFLGGVPGTVGGGMIMNAGTYAGEFKDVTVRVDSIALDTGELISRNNSECGFAYRRSAIPANEIVVEAELALKPRPRAEIEADVKALRARRHEREPKKVSSAGSIFKNPPGDFAGRLIEACDLKGTAVGDALCSPVHANWLVNTGNAKAADLLALIELVRDKVQAVHGVALELEVKIVGEDAT